VAKAGKIETQNADPTLRERPRDASGGAQVFRTRETVSEDGVGADGAQGPIEASGEPIATRARKLDPFPAVPRSRGPSES